MSTLEDRRPDRRRVLVVDDTDDDRTVYAAMLRSAGYTVLEAYSALQAMRMVLEQPPDAVVLDLVLPDWHGIEVARAFKATMPTRSVCVVALTSRPVSVELVDPHTFGAETVLIKPVAPERLLEAVARCFDDTAVLQRLAWIDPRIDEGAPS